MSKSEYTLQRFAAKYPRKDGRVLVVGSRIYETSPDRRAYYPDAFGIDMLDGPGVDLQHNLERPLEGHGQFAHIDLCSVLEHVRRPWMLAKNVEKLMMPGGTILISVPFAWRIHSYPSDFWRMTPEALDVLFPSILWLGKKLLVGTHLRKTAPGLLVDGENYLARAETVAFGVRC